MNEGEKNGGLLSGKNSAQTVQRLTITTGLARTGFACTDDSLNHLRWRQHEIEEVSPLDYVSSSPSLTANQIGVQGVH
jgi:hypothetical protein